MFNLAYSESMEDEQQSARDSEREVIQRSTEMMQESDENPHDAQSRVRAIHFTSQIWSYFLNDLVSVENQTADELKASLMSLGIFILKHLESMRKDPSLNFEPVTEISKTIQQGLK